MSGIVQNTMMRVGCHVSISGAISNSVDNAIKRECTAFQIFTRNPRGWHAKPIADVEAGLFRSKLAKSGIEQTATCAHMPYLPNLSGPNEEPYRKSVKTLIDEVERCGVLGLPFLVTHLGSHLGSGEEAGIDRLVAAYNEAATVDNDVTILLENTAGQKNSVGYDFDQLAEILSRLEPSDRFGVCLDTCHAFVSGYDLRTREAAAETLDKFDGAIGYDQLRILHLNDARGPLGCNLDRHYHIGLGEIGEEGLGEVIRTANHHDIPIILETPIDEVRADIDNISKARELA